MENVKKIVDVVVEIGNVIPEVKNASTFVGRVRAIGALTDELMDLATLDIGEMKKEWDVKTPEQLEQLKAHAKAKYYIEDDKLEQFIEQAVEKAFDLIGWGIDVADLVKAYKAAV